MATTTQKVNAKGKNREEVAEIILEHFLTVDEPITDRALARTLGFVRRDGDEDAAHTRAALAVLVTRQQAKLVEGGWVLSSSPLEAVSASPVEVEFPYEFHTVSFDQMFVDPGYQRPITTFAQRIEQKFDPVLFQTLTLSDRSYGDYIFDERGVLVGIAGLKKGARKFAIIDGQTRWHAAGRRGITAGPCIVFQGLTPEDEADIFWRLQKERRGMVSWHRFRAQLRSKDAESMAIANLVEQCGYVLGDRADQLSAVAALESCYRSNGFILERTLVAYKAAWPTRVPEGRFIRGLHYFFRTFPVDQPRRRMEIDDERLVRRLSVAGPDGLTKKFHAAKESGMVKGSPEKLMALAIQSVYMR